MALLPADDVCNSHLIQCYGQVPQGSLAFFFIRHLTCAVSLLGYGAT